MWMSLASLVLAVESFADEGVVNFSFFLAEIILVLVYSQMKT
jgi:hypothetical protein